MTLFALRKICLQRHLYCREFLRIFIVADGHCGGAFRLIFVIFFFSSEFGISLRTVHFFMQNEWVYTFLEQYSLSREKSRLRHYYIVTFLNKILFNIYMQVIHFKVCKHCKPFQTKFEVPLLSEFNGTNDPVPSKYIFIKMKYVCRDVLPKVFMSQKFSFLTWLFRSSSTSTLPNFFLLFLLLLIPTILISILSPKKK